MIRVAMEAARAAGRLIDAAGPQVRAGYRHKGAVDLVTSVDLACEDTIREILTRQAPGIPVFAEEGGGSLASTRWIVDPLDGTLNFVHDYPWMAVNVALEEAGQVVLACTWDAVNHRMYHATLGGGAFCDDGPIRVSSTDDLGHALLASGFPYDRREKAAFYLKFVRAFLERSQAFRRSGSAAMDLVHVASGRADGYWEMGLKPWDMAPGVLLVREAGGRVTDLEGGDFFFDRARILASNGRIHDAMVTVLRQELAGEGQPGDI